MEIRTFISKVPVLGSFTRFLTSPTGHIFKINLRKQKGLIAALLAIGNSMAFIMGARALLMVAFLQVITNSEINVIPESWFEVARPFGLAWVENFEYGKMAVLAFGLIILSLSNFLMEFCQKVLTSKLDVRFVAEQRKLIANYVMRYDASFFAKSRISEVNQIFSMFAVSISNVLNYVQHSLNSILKMIVILAALFYLDSVLTVAIFCTAMCLWPIMTRMQKRTHHIATARRDFDIKAGGLFADLMYGMRLIKQSNQQERFKKDYFYLTDQRDTKQVEYMRAMALANMITQIFGMATVMGLAFVVFFLKEMNLFTNIGFILGYVIMVQRFFAEVSVLVNYYTAIGQELPHLHSMNNVLSDDTILETYYFKGERKDFKTDSVAVKNCSFEYHDNVPVLHDVTLNAQAGTVTAILGVSGSGKSTLFEIMSGYRSVPDGVLTIGGMPLSDIDIKEYRARSGYLTQDTLMFNMNVKENISFIKTDATEQDVIEAAKKAQAHDFIMELQDGYDTNVGDRGANVSGGQRQRLAIARLILQDPEIIFMDEATSGLDFETEKKIIQSMFAHARATNKTLFIATHRLVTVAQADNIIFIHRGEIAEEGTHEELMAKGGMYHDLYNFQTQIENLSEENLKGLKQCA